MSERHGIAFGSARRRDDTTAQPQSECQSEIPRSPNSVPSSSRPVVVHRASDCRCCRSPALRVRKPDIRPACFGEPDKRSSRHPPTVGLYMKPERTSRGNELAERIVGYTTRRTRPGTGGILAPPIGHVQPVCAAAVTTIFLRPHRRFLLTAFALHSAAYPCPRAQCVSHRQRPSKVGRT